MLVDEEFRIYQETKSRRWLIFDRNAKAALAFDQARQEPTFRFVGWKSFLLIGCTGRIVTTSFSDVVPPDAQLFQHIAKFYNGR